MQTYALPDTVMHIADEGTDEEDINRSFDELMLNYASAFPVACCGVSEHKINIQFGRFLSDDLSIGALFGWNVHGSEPELAPGSLSGGRIPVSDREGGQQLFKAGEEQHSWLGINTGLIFIY